MLTNKIILLIVAFLFLNACSSAIQLACADVACKPAEAEQEPEPDPTTPAISSFAVTGSISGTSISGKKVFCSTVEQTPVEQSQTLAADGAFSLTFNKTGQIPVRCILANSDNSFASDVVFSEALSRSIKGDSTLRSVVAVRKADTSTLNLGTIIYNGQLAQVSATTVTQNGVEAVTGSWSDLSGVWSRSADLTLTTFANNYTNFGNTVSATRWNQSSATDDLGSLHTGLSTWMYDAENTPTDSLAGCQNKEGYALQAGWTATVNASAFQIFSDPAVNFSTLASTTATAAFADVNYGTQNICGLTVVGQNCDTIDFSAVSPMLKGGLNDNQCLLLCVIKSIDALNHMQHPSFANCPFEYKTDLSGDLTTKIPSTGECTAANGNPCPGLIDKPERVLSRAFYEEAKVVADTASFFIARTDNVRHCTVDTQMPNFPDGDFSDPGECYTCGYEEKISVVVRRLSSTQAYASQRVSKIPLATNSPTKCDSGAEQDNSFLHRAQVGGLSNVDTFLYTGNSFSHVYLMTK